MSEAVSTTEKKVGEVEKIGAKINSVDKPRKSTVEEKEDGQTFKGKRKKLTDNSASSSVDQPSNANKHIFFERSTRTFRLYSRSTLYAFHVDDYGRLEHLYWGPALDQSLDLLYLRSANVPLTFETTDDDDEAAVVDIDNSPAAFQTDLLRKTTSGIRAAWKEHRGQKSDVYRRRVENTSWRLFGMRNQPPHEVEKRRMRAEQLKNLPSFTRNPIEEECKKSRSKSPGKEFQAVNEMPFAGNQSKFTRSQTALGLNKSTNLNSRTPALSKNSIGDRFGKGSIKHEYSDHGTGDFRPPSFQLSFSNGSTTSPVRYVKHAIFPGRLPIFWAKRICFI